MSGPLVGKDLERVEALMVEHLGVVFAALVHPEWHDDGALCAKTCPSRAGGVCILLRQFATRDCPVATSTLVQHALERPGFGLASHGVQ